MAQYPSQNPPYPAAALLNVSAIAAEKKRILWRVSWQQLPLPDCPDDRMLQGDASVLKVLQAHQECFDLVKMVYLLEEVLLDGGAATTLPAVTGPPQAKDPMLYLLNPHMGNVNQVLPFLLKAVSPWQTVPPRGGQQLLQDTLAKLILV
ncbi:hypothetical protein P7K49_025205 [Saguinus oedipus]|uniref:Uncharacterized protein n=1 Tax=Saguinus oedipus TaxID=9490 RepID=A0ABQ9UH05_SAGOE|nr:hypothetical protein P7K49_025205 [Saguinus oedipus]